MAEFLDLFKTLGSTAIISGFAVWLIKRIIDSFFKNRSEDYRHELSLILEEHKSSLGLQYAKASKLHDKRLIVIAEFYRLIAKLDSDMAVMTQYVKWSSGDHEKEEKERIKAATNSYNDFLDYYSEHRIFFRIETCELIDSMQKLFKEGYSKYTMARRFNIQDFDIKLENSKKSFETISEKIPPILRLVEKEFRNEIGL